LDAGSWNDFGDLKVSFSTDGPKILFGFYSVSLTVAGTAINFRL